MCRAASRLPIHTAHLATVVSVGRIGSRGVVALVAVLVVTAGGCSDDESPSSAPTAPAPPSSDQVPLEVGLLQPGDCFNGLDRDDVEVTVVPCANAHGAEMTGRFLLDGEEFPGEDEVLEQAEEGCLAIFEDYAGQPAEETELRFTELTPTESQWEAGAREVACIVLPPEAGELTRSSVRDGV